MSALHSSFARGARHALPFLVVIVPFAMMFGLVASKAGLNLTEITAFSLTVFAGASQIAAVQLLQDHAPVWVILVTSLAVNLRLMMYSMALSPHFGSAPLGIRAAMAYFRIDQSYALSELEFDRRRSLTLAEKTAYFFGTVSPLFPVWIGSAIAGAQMGRAIPPQFALDFAVPITFLAMTAPSVRSVAHLAAGMVAVGVTLALLWLPYGTGLIVGAAAGMTVGACLEVWQERRG
jgi:predicted branched-subunit amino acid permease